VHQLQELHNHLFEGQSQCYSGQNNSFGSQTTVYCLEQPCFPFFPCSCAFEWDHPENADASL